jgi:hypothetical protein
MAIEVLPDVPNFADELILQLNALGATVAVTTSFSTEDRVNLVVAVPDDPTSAAACAALLAEWRTEQPAE